MWPWGHLAVGYLAYATYSRYWRLEHPGSWAVVAVTLGTQLPDLVDKPLAYWWFLPEGRSLAHSLLVAVPVCVAVLWLAWRARRWALGLAFAVGYLTHLAADTVLDVVAWNVEGLSFLLWPALAAPDYEASDFAHHVAQLETSVRSAASLSPGAWYFILETALFAVVLGVWAQHRFPPLSGFATWVRAGRGGGPDGSRSGSGDDLRSP